MVESGRSPSDHNAYGSGVASLIGGSISLDGQSIQLPDDSGYDVQDDVSSIHDSTYLPKGSGHQSPNIKIVGTVGSMEEGNFERLSPASIALSCKQVEKEGDDKEKTMSTTLDTSPQKRPPNMRNTSKLSVDGEKGGKGCLPRWVSAAPKWLKFVIAFSTALLVGAVVLVSVALSTALASRENTSTTSVLTYAPGILSPPSSPGVIFTSAPSGPTTFLFDTESDASQSTAPEAETERPNIADPKNDPESPHATRLPTASPTRALQPDSIPDAAGSTPLQTEDQKETSDSEQATLPTSSPTRPEEAEVDKGGLNQDDNADGSLAQGEDPASLPYDSFVTTFFVTGGRFTNDALAQVPDQLRTLPIRGGTSFLVHLGDWNSPYATRCDRQSYKDVDDLFSNSSVPVYFIPGDNDFNDCPDPEQAMSFWHEYLLEYETEHWDEPEQWAVARGAPDQYPENFAFSYNDILFVGINLVGGVVHDGTEWATRQSANLEWIDANYQQHKDTMKAFVLFAHADPDVPSNSPFYEPFKERVKKEYNKVPVVLIHRNLGVEPWSWETEFENIDNLDVIVVAGSVWPPLMGAVDFRQEHPFIFDQSNWYDEYIEHQTNNVPV